MLPSLFIAHGAPLLAIQQNEYTAFLSDLGKKLPKPDAVVLFSAHWESNVQQVSQVAEYDTIYDFGGFPDEMYRIKYPAKGDERLTQEVGRLLTENGIAYKTDEKRGLDHGAWVVLRLLYPNADIPVIAMSVDQNISPEAQYKIGSALQTLRKQNVLIIGSGGTVHNLRMLNWGSKTADDWAVSFDQWLEASLKEWNTSDLFQYETKAPNASYAVPPRGKEHFVPLFYAMGAADDARKAELLFRNYDYGSLSHSVWQFV